MHTSPSNSDTVLTMSDATKERVFELFPKFSSTLIYKISRANHSPVVLLHSARMFVIYGNQVRILLLIPRNMRSVTNGMNTKTSIRL